MFKDKFALVRQYRPQLARKSNGEITNIIRRDFENDLDRELKRLERESSSGLGFFSSFFEKKRASNQFEVERSIKARESQILERIRIRIASRYGITVAMLDSFVQSSFQARLRNWEAEQQHGRDKDKLEHFAGQQIRVEKARAKIERGKYRSKVFWDTASFVVGALAQVGSEYVKTREEQKRLMNRIHLAAEAKSLAGDAIAERRMNKARAIHRQLKYERDPFERKILKARLNGLLKELGLEPNRTRKPNSKKHHRKNPRRTNTHRDLRRSSRKGNKNSSGGGRKR